MQFSLIEVFQKDISLIEQQQFVADYWNAGQGWKWEILCPLLPSEIQAHLSAFFLRMDSDADDSICWALSPNGMFFFLFHH